MTARLLMMLMLVTVLTSATPADVPAATTLTGFTDEFVTTVPAPTSLSFLPDGRMLVTSRNGQLYLYDGTARVVLDISNVMCTNFERGLLGVAVDPNFTTNRYVFLYYTVNRDPGSANACTRGVPNAPFNRVSRFVLPPSNTIDRSSETILVDNIISTAGNHNGGDLKFGRDGYLYVSIGDGGCDYRGDSGCQGGNDAARDDNVLLGKILRITRDGGIPADNPYLGPTSARCNVNGITDPGKQCQETWAKGLRNPYRIAVDQKSSSQRLFINDVGEGQWEEVNEGKPRADYGWNIREGHCANDSTTDCGAPPAGLTNPLVDYSHSTGCRSITGGAFAPRGWAVPYFNGYFFSDFICGKIFWIDLTEQGTPQIREFATEVGQIVAMEVGPGPNGRQSLYYTTFGSGGSVRRINYTAVAPGEPRAYLPLVWR